MLDQFPRQHQELLTNRIDGRVQAVWGQTQAFEPRHDVAAEKQQLQKRPIGHPFVGGDFVQGETVEQFPDGLLHLGARPVGFPNYPGLQLQAGHKARVTVSALAEERELLGFLGIVGYGATNHDEPVCGGPSLRLETKFRHRPPNDNSLKPARSALGK